jgi:hypothetical protein
MYGYVVPDKSKIPSEAFVLYSAFFCGICKQLGKQYGQMERFSTNYDITFFAALLHDQNNQPVTFSEERCVGNPLKKKVIIGENPLLERIANVNILLSYYKLLDGIIDGEGGSKLKQKLFFKAMKQASEKEPECNLILHSGYLRLREMEKKNEASIDRVSDCFASLLRDCAKQLLEKEEDTTLRLVYNVGKFVYIADALDDIGEDNKAKRYNPFLAAFGGYKNRTSFIESNKQELEFIFASTVNRAIECFCGMKFNQSFSLLENIVVFGMRKKVTELLESKRKLKRPKV